VIPYYQYPDALEHLHVNTVHDSMTTNYPHTRCIMSLVSQECHSSNYTRTVELCLTSHSTYTHTHTHTHTVPHRHSDISLLSVTVGYTHHSATQT